MDHKTHDGEILRDRWASFRLSVVGPLLAGSHFAFFFYKCGQFQEGLPDFPKKSCIHPFRCMPLRVGPTLKASEIFIPSKVDASSRVDHPWNFSHHLSQALSCNLGCLQAGYSHGKLQRTRRRDGSLYKEELDGTVLPEALDHLCLALLDAGQDKQGIRK